MELQEILDLVEGRKSISEMSFPLKQVRLNLMNSSLLDKRVEHLILIYYFRD